MVVEKITSKSDNRGRISLGSEFANQQITVSIDRDIDLDNIEIMRAVHFLDANDYGRACLYSGWGRSDAEALIGIDWKTGPVWAKEAFASHEEDRALDDYNAMTTASDGSLVAAYYGRRMESMNKPDPYHLNNSIVIGICPPNSSVKAIPVERAKKDGVTFVKTLPLINTVEITRDEKPELFEKFAQGRSVYKTPTKAEIIKETYTERVY